MISVDKLICGGEGWRMESTLVNAEKLEFCCSGTVRSCGEGDGGGGGCGLQNDYG